jgi:hypothetical protein
MHPKIPPVIIAVRAAGPFRIAVALATTAVRIAQGKARMRHATDAANTFSGRLLDSKDSSTEG